MNRLDDLMWLFFTITLLGGTVAMLLTSELVSW
jgi:hypothetical protein